MEGLWVTGRLTLEGDTGPQSLPLPLFSFLVMKGAVSVPNTLLLRYATSPQTQTDRPDESWTEPYETMSQNDVATIGSKQ